MDTITNNNDIQHQRIHSMPVGNIYNHIEQPLNNNNNHYNELLFGLTQNHLPIYQQDQTSLCQIELKCKVDRGFFLCDQHWTCYRRNYFQITTAFTTLNCPTNEIFYFQPSSSSSNKLPIHQFYIQVIATSSDGNNKNVDLIQLTAKRDKGPQRKPPMISICPNHHQYSELIHHHSNDNHHHTTTTTTTNNNNNIKPQKTATFERLQFKSATANNGKKRASQQYYYLFIQLIGECNDESSSKYILASCQSLPLVVRGRSPGHYNDSLDHKHSPYSKLSSTNLKKKQQKKEIPSTLSLNHPLETKENDLISTPTPSIPSNNNNNIMTTTPTIPSNHTPLFYNPHIRSLSANDTNWHSPRQSYRSTNWHQFQMISSSSSSSSSSSTSSSSTSTNNNNNNNNNNENNHLSSPIPNHHSPQQQHPITWSSSNEQNHHQRTQSTNTIHFNTYPINQHHSSNESSSNTFHQHNDFQSSSSPIILSSQQQPSTSMSSSSSTSSNSTISNLSQNHTPTTFMLYPNGPWNAIDHKPMTDFQNNEMKQ